MDAEKYEQLERSAPLRRIATPKVTVEESSIDRISSTVLPMFSRKNSNVSFDLIANLWERDWEGNRVHVLYHLMLDTTPAVLQTEILGRAVIMCPKLSEKLHLGDLGESFASNLAVEIFRKNYESIYLLMGSLNLPQPSPWVLKSVELREPRREGEVANLSRRILIA